MNLGNFLHQTFISTTVFSFAGLTPAAGLRWAFCYQELFQLIPASALPVAYQAPGKAYYRMEEYKPFPLR
jgi:hypothetical protein